MGTGRAARVRPAREVLDQPHPPADARLHQEQPHGSRRRTAFDQRTWRLTDHTVMASGAAFLTYTRAPAE
jgi:hypothetical protein